MRLDVVKRLLIILTPVENGVLNGDSGSRPENATELGPTFEPHMATQIRLQKSQIADLETIRDLGPERLERVVECLDATSVTPLHGKTLLKIVADALGDLEQATDLMRPLVALGALIRQARFTPNDVLEGLRSALRPAASQWSEEQFQQWVAIEPQLQSLLSANAIRIATKATDLAYDYANLLNSARIISDIRPVFSDDEDATDILGAVVSYTLRLTFDSRDENHSLSIALDEGDVRELMKQCDRALKKAHRAKTWMVDRAGIPAIISGDEDEHH